MRYRSRERSWGRRLARPPLTAGHRVVSIVDSGGQALVTTAAAHGLSAGQTVIISGTSNVNYLGEQEVAVQGLTATAFEIGAAQAGGTSRGGTWVLP